MGHSICLYLFFYFFFIPFIFQWSTYNISYLINYWTDLHQIFRIGKSMEVLAKSCIHVAITQGTLQWRSWLTHLHFLHNQ